MSRVQLSWTTLIPGGGMPREKLPFSPVRFLIRNWDGSELSREEELHLPCWRGVTRLFSGASELHFPRWGF